MKVRAYDLVNILSQVDLVKSSKLLSQEQKQDVFKEMLTDLPMDMFCSGQKNTRAALVDVLSKEITKDEPKKKVAPKSKKPKHGEKK
jgi:hypothetical protein|tara:strand:+ start:1698 stop:1958 length:261 start_codon:yes stop_codon:yes gene_type:complete